MYAEWKAEVTSPAKHRPRLVRADRRPVRRFNASRYLLYLLVSFGLSVLVTRVFLELTGYPKIGGGGAVHVAHVLWGGLLLFAGALVVLLLSNQWTLTVSSLLWGIGVGLFIDEVGKFITANNDYFVPIAAPIIYAVFLIVAWIYMATQKPPPLTPRAELYRVLDLMKEVLDHDLDADEKKALEMSLERVRQETADRNVYRLATELLDFVRAEELHLVDPNPSSLEQALVSARDHAQRRIGRRSLRGLLVAAFLALALLHTITVLTLSALVAGDPGGFSLPFQSGPQQYVLTEPLVLVLFAVLATGVGLLYVLAGYDLVRHNERRGTRAAMLALLLSLTVVNLMVYYFNLFQAMGLTLVEIVILTLVLEYRRRYVSGAALGA